MEVGTSIEPELELLARERKKNLSDGAILPLMKFFLERARALKGRYMILLTDRLPRTRHVRHVMLM